MSDFSNLARLQDVAKAGLNTWLFRGTCRLPAVPTSAELRLYAEQRYHAWLNGAHVGRGPAFHHPTVLPIDSRDVASRMRAGHNVVAVLVQFTDVAMHNHVNNGEPGLVAELIVDGRAIDLDWRSTDRSGWRGDSPRRSWAVDYVEEFDMKLAPRGWQSADFDDSGWNRPETIKPATRVGRFIDRPIPPLRATDIRPAQCTGVFAMMPLEAHRPTSSGQLAATLNGNTMSLLPIRLPDDGQNFTIDRDTMACFDLGKEYVGQVMLECDCPGEGVIDIGFSEVAVAGRPVLARKGVGYVDRIYAAEGSLAWQPVQFSGFRHIAVAFRGFDGPVRVKRVYCRATEPDVQWRGTFHSSDATLNAVFDLCVHSQRVGTQDGQMDCPTREQAPYIGDGVLTARWFAELTGDARHYRYVIREQFRRQAGNGALRSSLFTGSNDVIIDYTLLAVIAVRDYLRYTDDRELAKELLEPCRRALNYFNSHRRGGGLSTWIMPTLTYGLPWENTYDPAVFDRAQRPILFIDHPGLGWHNKDEAGIDRRGPSAALNALIVQAERALAELEAAAGHADRALPLRHDADQLAKLIGDAFFDRQRGVFVDCLVDGRQSPQVSEQTNTWCIAAGCCDDDTARSIITMLLRSDDPFIARNGPYFWSYLYPQMARLGLHELAIEKTRTLWGRMLAGGATTLWETFLGDDLDSWCHPWSGAPIEFLLCHVLGLPAYDFAGDEIVLRPRIDLLPQAKGSICTRLGWFAIEWKDGKVAYDAPAGVQVKLAADYATSTDGMGR